jgi:hypothetical protein
MGSLADLAQAIFPKEGRENVARQLQQGDPTTPAASMETIAKAWAQWRAKQTEFDPANPPIGFTAPGLGTLAAGLKGGLRPPPAHSTKITSAEQGFVYHATNLDNAQDIAKQGLKTHGPSYGTDQSTWPDGATERRSYFSTDPHITESFAPEHGKPVFLRVKEAAAKFFRESTGDMFARKQIAPTHIEYLGADGSWHPIQEMPE